MPCVVYLLFSDSEKIICVKSAWCQANNIAETVNNGSRPGEMVKKFFSPNKFDQPNFGLTERDLFDDTVAACYFGFVLDHFGKLNRSK